MKLDTYSSIDLMKISLEDIPKIKGIYVYTDKNTNEIEYIGSAVGNNGLRGRVWSQHLNEKYLEGRKERVGLLRFFFLRDFPIKFRMKHLCDRLRKLKMVFTVSEYGESNQAKRQYMIL